MALGAQDGAHGRSLIFCLLRRTKKFEDTRNSDAADGGGWKALQVAGELGTLYTPFKVSLSISIYIYM